MPWLIRFSTSAAIVITCNSRSCARSWRSCTITNPRTSSRSSPRVWGSYMCYDTLLKMSRGERIMGEKEYSADVVQDLIGHTNYVYMLANQLPLLELSEVSNPLPLGHAPDTAVKALAEIRRQNKPKIRPQQPPAPFALHLVAFSDPNDLLSYPLDHSSISGSTI